MRHLTGYANRMLERFIQFSYKPQVTLFMCLTYLENSKQSLTQTAVKSSDPKVTWKEQ